MQSKWNPRLTCQEAPGPRPAPGPLVVSTSSNYVETLPHSNLIKFLKWLSLIFLSLQCMRSDCDDGSGTDEPAAVCPSGHNLPVLVQHQCSRRVSLLQTFAAAAVEREVTTASRDVMRLRDDAEVCSGL